MTIPACRKALQLQLSNMSRVQENENAVEQLPPEVFSELAAWIDRKREVQHTRDHSAFLNSYAPGDEGLYDDAIAR